MTGYVDIPAGLEFGLTGCLPGRTYWLLIRTAFPEPFYRLDDLTPCGSLYTVSLNTTPCTAEVGACCSYAASPTCTDSVDSMDVLLHQRRQLHGRRHDLYRDRLPADVMLPCGHELR